MPLYEHIFLTRQDVSAAQVETLTENFKSIIEQGGGKIGRTEYWGVRSLSFRIKKNRKAHYSLMDIDAPHEAVAEMERQQGLNDDVIRILTLKVDAHEEGASVMMQQRSSRDDRRGPRRDRPDDNRRDAPRRPAEATDSKPAPEAASPDKTVAAVSDDADAAHAKEES